MNGPGYITETTLEDVRVIIGKLSDYYSSRHGQEKRGDTWVGRDKAKELPAQYDFPYEDLKKILAFAPITEKHGNRLVADGLIKPTKNAISAMVDSVVPKLKKFYDTYKDFLYDAEMLRDVEFKCKTGTAGQLKYARELLAHCFKNNSFEDKLKESFRTALEYPPNLEHVEALRNLQNTLVECEIKCGKPHPKFSQMLDDYRAQGIADLLEKYIEVQKLCTQGVSRA